MPSESVWFEQVDIAFKSYIENIVKLKNKEGVLVPVPVSIQKPDEDFKLEVYPSITLYNLYSRRDNNRYNPEPVIVSRDVETNTLVQEKSAIPYNLFYQLNFWSRTNTQMNDMTRLWLGNNPDRFFNLPVKDMSGNDRDCLVLMRDELVKADLIQGKERTFHSILTYKVQVELDERISVNTPMITSVQPDVDISN